MSERRTHHNICQRGERCACYLTGFTDAEYDHGLALDTLEPAKSELASSTGYLRRWRVGLIIAWYDLWVGAYWNAASRKLYILPLPCVGIVIEFPKADNIRISRGANND